MMLPVMQTTRFLCGTREFLHRSNWAAFAEIWRFLTVLNMVAISAEMVASLLVLLRLQKVDMSCRFGILTAMRGLQR